jgi:hypothetical protein
MAKRKNLHAAALSKLGAKKGGRARWEGVSPAERSEILSRAARARWAKARPKAAAKSRRAKPPRGSG